MMFLKSFPVKLLKFIIMDKLGNYNLNVKPQNDNKILTELIAFVLQCLKSILSLKRKV